MARFISAATFFTSDTHFGDHRTLNIHKRPFASVAQMDEALITRWNDNVGAEDDVWHLGDFARRGDAVEGLLAALHGRKHLVAGNNDPELARLARGWAGTCDYAELEMDGRLLILCHYPFRSWNGQHKGSINLHGHSHGRMKKMLRQYDVGVDACDLRPVTLQQMLKGP